VSEAPVPEGSRRVEAARPGRTALRSLTPPDAAADPGRAMIVHTVSVTVSAGRASVSVELRQQGEQAVGVTEGALAAGSLERLVAEATLRAAGGLDSEVGLIALVAVTVAAAGTATVATAVLVHGERSLVGVAVVNAAGAADAVARAVVDALARRSASP
jgi:hypothetical protein